MAWKIELIVSDGESAKEILSEILDPTNLRDDLAESIVAATTFEDFDSEEIDEEDERPQMKMVVEER